MAKKPFIKKIVLIFLFITFLLGIYFCAYGNKRDGFEGTAAADDEKRETGGPAQRLGLDSCADILVRRGEEIYLYNSKTPSVSPVTFKNLDEYVSYLEKQRESGTRCPVLYLQEENNAQGEDVFRIRPSFDGRENGLPANTTFVPPSVLVKDSGGYNRNSPTPSNVAVTPIIDATTDHPPYNVGYTPFDPYGQHIGNITKLDQLHTIKETQYISDNPMDSNWGGPEYTKAQVLSGAYDENIVMRPNYVTPKN
jgi:cbb3-type cytochrome oxidase subunit 3